MTKRWLQEINNIDGVTGVYLSSMRGKVIDKIDVPYSDRQLESLTVRFLRIIAVFHLQTRHNSEIEFYWQNQYIICRYAHNFLLITFCSSIKVLPLLRITLNVALANLLEDKKFSKWLKAHVSDKLLPLKKGNLDDIEKKLISKLK